jgi:hypothetical protein
MINWFGNVWTLAVIFIFHVIVLSLQHQCDEKKKFFFGFCWPDNLNVQVLAVFEIELVDDR